MTDATPTAAEITAAIPRARAVVMKIDTDAPLTPYVLESLIAQALAAHAAQAVAAETERCAQIARDCHALHGPGDGRIAASWIETVILHARAGRPGQETT